MNAPCIHGHFCQKGATMTTQAPSRVGNALAGLSNQPSPAVLSIWNDIDPEIEEEYEAWYQKDHLRDRVATPGFRSCRRYQRVRGEGRAYFTFSDLDSIDILSAAPYRERLRDATEWTRRIMPHFRRLVRVAADVTLERGDGTGAFAGTALYDQLGERRDAIFGAVSSALDGAMDSGRITRIRIFEANPAVNGLPNPEAALRPDPPRSTELAVVIEGTSEMAVARELERLQALPELASLPSSMPASVYRLLFSSRS
jgi:hypothetical protein